MKIQTEYIYHIKDNFFDIVNDDSLMTNHERGINLFFTDIDKIKQMMLEELSEKTEKIAS